VFVALSTEILSIPRLITRPALAVAWLMLAVASFFYAAKIRAGRLAIPERGSKSDSAPLDKFDWFLLSLVGLLVALIGIAAIVSAPNTWDAMAYHMSRIAQWMTNRDVNLYPAFYSVQLFLSPWAEYAMMHLDVLYGADRLVNLIEWFSMIGSILGVSLIAQELGAGRRGQVFAATAAATLPGAVLEASGAMNTCVGMFWIVAAVYYVLRWNERQTPILAWAIGATVALAIMTKGTAWVLLPCTLLACWWIGSPAARKLLLARIPVVLLAILVLNGPLLARNYKLSGSPLGFPEPMGDDPLRTYSNSHYSASITLGNILKNLALHLATPIGGINQRVNWLIFSTSQRFGLDLNNPASTWRGGFHLNHMSAHEERAGDPLQLALIFVSCLFLLSPRAGRTLRIYMLGLFTSFVLFCALMRWQPWNVRFHLPLFALGVALAGVVFERRVPRYALAGIACLLLLAAFPLAILNSLRPLLSLRSPSIFSQSRTETYFADSHEWQMHSYVAAVGAVQAITCDSIGLDSSFDDFDYPILALLDAGHGRQQVRYSEVRGLTAEYARPDSTPPCVVICLRCANSPAKWAEYRRVGGRVSVFDEIAVFSQSGDSPNTQNFVLPVSYDPGQLVDELDRYRESPLPVALGPLEDRVIRAGHDWPDKKTDLKARLDALYVGTLSLWRVRDSVDPMRRRGSPIDNSKIDPVQLVGASEVVQHWYQTEPGKVQELDNLIDQLYSGRSARLNK
jgi:hypothetical protein